jgi:putative transposase
MSLCRRLKMSRQNYYRREHQRTRREVQGEALADFARTIRHQHPRMGCLKIWTLFGKQHPEPAAGLGRDRAFDELGARGLLVPRKKGQPRTTCSRHNLPYFRNEITALESDEINQIWVSDVTYLKVGDGHQYLSLVTDQYSRRIVGYYLSEDLSHRGTLKSLEMGLASLPAEAKPIHHSDRGSHYASHEYVRQAQAKGLTISMTEVEHCAENALAERMNGILKQEYELDGHFASGEQARASVKQAVWLYNEERPHRSLGLQTPSRWHDASGAKNSWHPAPSRLATLASTLPDAIN